MNRSPRRAFTLLEMLVSVGIIMLLAGLTVSATVTLSERADRRATEDVLTLLDLAVSAWERDADRTITQGRATDGTYDLDLETELTFVISELLDVLERNAAAQEILARIPPKYVYRYVEGETPPWVYSANEYAALAEFIGSLTILDAWGVPIYSTHPGPPAAPGAPSDRDGTERTLNELTYGVAQHRRIRFVSAGPDRRFGNVTAPPSTPPATWVEDNVFSYPLDPDELGGPLP